METKTEPNPVEKKVEKEIAPRPARRWRALVFQAYLIAAVIGFGVLLALARALPYFALDLRITRDIQTIYAPWFALLMTWVSFLGFSPQVYMLTTAIVVLLYALGLRWEAVSGVVASLGVGLVGEGFKFFAHRPRPGADLVTVAERLHSYSFPSGHVLYFTAFFGFLLFLAFTLLKRSALRTGLIVLLACLILLVGPSRIYLGEHWASDVLGAYLLGSVWLGVSVYVYRWGKHRFFVQQPVAPEKPTSAASRAGD